MIRRAILLGFYSIGGQVLLLRELVASLNGDELFISTALFGWLVSVAVGAWLGGRTRATLRVSVLFVAGAVLLPVMILAARFSPMATGYMAGEVLPFTTAVLISMMVMLPVAVVSGWLFPVIAREGVAGNSVVKAYLFEGIGAFGGGLAIVFLVRWFSALQTAMAIALMVPLVEWVSTVRSGSISVPRAITALIALIVGVKAVDYAEPRLDEIKFHPLEVVRSFDTHYGRQAILTREDQLVLLTDNLVEAVYPDVQAAEDVLLPALAYHPKAQRILYVGRPEFGVAQLVDSIGGVVVEAVDPRWQLTELANEVLPAETGLKYLHSDATYLFSSVRSELESFDVFIMDTGPLDTYKNSRFLTSAFLSRIWFGWEKTGLISIPRDGLVVVPTDYDSDRYIGPDERRILATIYDVLKRSFEHVEVWPGTGTLFLASRSLPLDAPYDTVIARLEALEYEAQFVNRDYLFDRFDELKRERLHAALSEPVETSSVNKPVLPYLQALFRSKLNSMDRVLLTSLLGAPLWLVIFPLLLATFMAWAMVSSSFSSRYALFLYLVAGVVSLSLELVSFYVYQSFAGSLYTGMAVLIGAFMLGLATGTYFAHRSEGRIVGQMALLFLLILTLGFERTYYKGSLVIPLFYHAAFLFAAAAVTGGLFVAATRMYYQGVAERNRGVGYAFELAGSSTGALLATTVLLPVIGLSWLLYSIAILLAVAFVGMLIRR